MGSLCVDDCPILPAKVKLGRDPCWLAPQSDGNYRAILRRLHPFGSHVSLVAHSLPQCCSGVRFNPAIATTGEHKGTIEEAGLQEPDGQTSSEGPPSVSDV